MCSRDEVFQKYGFCSKSNSSVVPLTGGRARPNAPEMCGACKIRLYLKSALIYTIRCPKVFFSPSFASLPQAGNLFGSGSVCNPVCSFSLGHKCPHDACLASPSTPLLFIGIKKSQELFRVKPSTTARGLITELLILSPGT